MGWRALGLLLCIAGLAGCTSPTERATRLANEYDRAYELFAFECREAMGDFATHFDENVSTGVFDSRHAALHHLDSLLHICQQDYAARLKPIADEYDQLKGKRYRLLGDYRRQFASTFDSLVRHRAADSTVFVDSLLRSARVWALLNSIKDPSLPSKTNMAQQLAGRTVTCVGDPYFHDSTYTLTEVEVRRIDIGKRYFNSQTGDAIVPVEIGFSHGHKEFVGTAELHYRLHDGDLDWQLQGITPKHFALRPNHAYDHYVQGKVCSDGSLLKRLHLINRSSQPVMVGCWVKYEQVGNFFRQKKTYDTQHYVITLAPSPNNKHVVDFGALKGSAVEGKVEFVIPL